MRALVTGAAGFCGKHLALRLSQEAEVVIGGLDVVTPSVTGFPFDEFYKTDITDSVAVSAAIGEFRPDFLFHLAGTGGGSSSENGAEATIYSVNTVGAITVLEAVLNYAPECTVLIAGSAAEYGLAADTLPVTENTRCCPESAYGISKYAATQAALAFRHRFGINVVITRAFNIIGPGIPRSMLVGALIDRARRALREPEVAVVEIGDVASERDFVAVTDVVDAYIRLARGRFWGEVFNICSGRPCSVRAVAEMLLANASRPIALKINPSLVRSSRARTFYGSHEKATQAIGYHPSTNLQEALRATWEGEMGVAICE
jgi:GDP-4-dehydro-6-deoxy-D-mannose reductase